MLSLVLGNLFSIDQVDFHFVFSKRNSVICGISTEDYHDHKFSCPLKLKNFYHLLPGKVCTFGACRRDN